MEELIAKVAGAAGIDNGLAGKAIGMILGFLQKDGPAGPVGELMAAIPGAQGLVDASAGGGGLMGKMGGMMGGGIMGLGAGLMGAGLDMGQIQSAGKALFEYGAEKAGPEVIGQIVQGTPGLSQFV